jgi:hypothetical protein
MVDGVIVDGTADGAIVDGVIAAGVGAIIAGGGAMAGAGRIMATDITARAIIMAATIPITAVTAGGIAIGVADGATVAGVIADGIAAGAIGAGVTVDGATGAGDANPEVFSVHVPKRPTSGGLRGNPGAGRFFDAKSLACPSCNA